MGQNPILTQVMKAPRVEISSPQFTVKKGDMLPFIKTAASLEICFLETEPSLWQRAQSCNSPSYDHWGRRFLRWHQICTGKSPLIFWLPYTLLQC